MDQDAVRSHLTGPVSSIMTTFNQDGSVDEQGLRNFIDVSIAGGSSAIILTAGDSHYNSLSDQEIADVTRITCQHTAGRVMVVAADRYFATSKALKFAEYVRDLGVDLYMLLPPTWGRCTPQDLADHYVTVGQIMPVMLVTAVFERFDDAFALEALRLMLDQSDQIMAIKDDRGAPFVHRMCLHYHQRCAIFAGGQKTSHLGMVPFGCDGYMSMFVTFKPEISTRYWKAITARDFPEAQRIVRDYDVALWQHLLSHPDGWNAACHGMLELYGIAKRWRRKPLAALGDEAMEKLGAFLRSRQML